MGRGSRSWTRPSPRAISAPNPLGQRLRFVELGDRIAEVVGISAASRHNSVFMPPQPFIYLPFAQHPASRATLVAHTVGEPAALAGALRGVVEAIDANVPVYRVESTAELFDDAIEAPGQAADGHRGLRWAWSGLTMALIGLYAIVVVSGEPPHPRDRHSHGDRRDAGPGAPRWCSGTRRDGRHGRRDRHGRQRCRGPEA